MPQIVIDEDPCARAREAAEREGFETLEAFVTAAITERVGRPKRVRFQEAARRLRERAVEAGLSEKAILAEFERFRGGHQDPAGRP
jgi:hypothetical protein